MSDSKSAVSPKRRFRREVSSFLDECATCTPAGDVVKLIAILNYRLPDDHPGKITRADVVVARDIADNSGAWTDDNRDALDRLAAKLAALLPPPRYALPESVAWEPSEPLPPDAKR